jgi:hypothetical protein
VSPETFTVSLDGGTLERGFWLYVWEATTPGGEVVLYVGRTGDSSSINAQSPFNRMGQHLGSAKNSSMLRNHLEARGVVPEECRFRLVAHGPVLAEADDRATHNARRDAAAGYNVLNTVRCLKPLDGDLYAGVRAAFAREFARL